MMVVQLRVVLTLPCNMSVPIRMQHNFLVALRQRNEVTIYWEILVTILILRFGDSEVNRQFKKSPIIRYQSQPDTRIAHSPSSNKHAHVR